MYFFIKVSKLCNKGSRFSTFEADNHLFDGVVDFISFFGQS